MPAAGAETASPSARLSAGCRTVDCSLQSLEAACRTAVRRGRPVIDRMVMAQVAHKQVSDLLLLVLKMLKRFANRGAGAQSHPRGVEAKGKPCCGKRRQVDEGSGHWWSVPISLSPARQMPIRPIGRKSPPMFQRSAQDRPTTGTNRQ